MSLAELIIYDTPERAIKAICNNEGDVNEWDRFGFRPLIQAVICRKPKVLSALIANGADIEQVDFIGRTALQWAANRGYTDCCKFLLEHGADPNHFSADGQPILVTPILREQLDLVELFIKFKANYEFAKDFISAKLLGHRYELTGEADIVSTDGKFIPLSFEGFYLEFSTALMRRSLYNFVHSIPGQKFEKYQGKLTKILHAMKNAAQLTEFSRHKDKSPFENTIEAILDSELLLIPSAYQGHAITFIKYRNLWAKCDRGVGKLADTVIIYEIGNPYMLNASYYKKLLYDTKTEDFIRYEIKEELALKVIKTMPTKSQISGNCSWANVETSVPAMLLMLSYDSRYQKPSDLAKIQKSIYHFYGAWIDWDKDCALDEALADFHCADQLRKLSKAIILGSVLVQRCSPANKREVGRAKKILQIITQPNFHFIIENYRKVYFKARAGKVGKAFKKLLTLCGINHKTLKFEDSDNYDNHIAKNSMQDSDSRVKMTTALHVACLTGKLEAVKYLVEKIKIDVNYLDRTGSTALMYAAWKGYLEIIKYMVDNGASISVKNLKGGTAIRYASYANNIEIVDYLKSKLGKCIKPQEN